AISSPPPSHCRTVATSTGVNAGEADAVRFMAKAPSAELPSLPFRAEREGTRREAVGRVRWVSASALESPTSPRPSPPPGAEREITATALRPSGYRRQSAPSLRRSRVRPHRAANGHSVRVRLPP